MKHAHKSKNLKRTLLGALASKQLTAKAELGVPVQREISKTNEEFVTRKLGLIETKTLRMLVEGA